MAHQKTQRQHQALEDRERRECTTGNDGQRRGIQRLIITIRRKVNYKGKSYDVEDLCEALLTTCEG